MKSLLSSLSAIVASALTIGCGGEIQTADTDFALDEAEAALHAQSGSAVLGLRIRGFEPLGAGYVYEGWLIADGQPHSAGRFNLRGADDTRYFRVPRRIAERAMTYVLTIEPAVGDDPAPAATHVLAGDFARGGHHRTAWILLGHGAALGTNFQSAGGGYILETPTTANIPGDFRQGIWFLNPRGPAASLRLPRLPAGWVYEGWTVGQDGARTTGRFTTPAGADSDGAGRAAGPDGAPPFPGQDYINPPLNLVGRTVVLSVEPQPDDSPAPFALKPLSDRVEDTGAAVLQGLTNTTGSTIQRGFVALY